MLKRFIARNLMTVNFNGTSKIFYVPNKRHFLMYCKLYSRSNTYELKIRTHQCLIYSFTEFRVPDFFDNHVIA